MERFTSADPAGGAWRFPSTDGGETHGISDPGIETFSNTPDASLAREICQNSLDAAKDNGKPVRVEFKAFEADRSRIPGFDKLVDSLRRCAEFAGADGKTRRFYKAAAAAVDGIVIRCLRISDFNTTGLTGSKKGLRTPWNYLVKSTGSSEKTYTKGGSFGVGKFAPFVYSQARTVFYSTLDEDGIAAHQGVARLASFEREDGQTAQGTGFYGNSENNALDGQLSLDPSFTRGEGDTGTDIYIISYSAGEDWEHEMIVAVLDGFLYAINEGWLEVAIQGTEINRDTLPRIIEEHRDGFKEHADEYFQVLRADESVAPWREMRFDDDPTGESIIKVRMLVGSGFKSRRVAVVRQTGMKILDKGSVDGAVQFAGVSYIEGEWINGLLRSIEDPAHKKWYPKRAEDPRQAKDITTRILHFMKDCLREQKGRDSGESMDLSVGEYLALRDGTGDDENRKEDLSDRIKDITIRRRKAITGWQRDAEDDPAAQKGDEADRGGDDPTGGMGTGSGFQGGDGATTSHGGPNPGIDEGPNTATDSGNATPVKTAKVRAICTDRKTGRYRILYTPGEDAVQGRIELFISAESESYPAAIASATDLTGNTLRATRNRITGLTFEIGKTVRLDVTLEDVNDYMSMEVKAYGNKA